MDADRPRERLLRDGASRLASNELLALVLGSGIAGASAGVVADRLVSEAGGLTALSRASAGELIGVSGVGGARAARVVSSFELGRRALLPSRREAIAGPDDIYRHVRPRIAGVVVETGIVIGLSAHNRILFDVENARGEATSLPVHPREVFRPLIRHGAVGGILVHNHPSGDPTPSEDDIALTLRLVAVGEVVGIPLIDHLVVASGGFTSLATLLGTEYRT